MVLQASSRCLSVLQKSLEQASCSSVLCLRGFTSLPVVDVGALVSTSRDDAAVNKAASELHKACRDVGFFYIKNHGVPPDVSEGVLSLAHKWFALPTSIKQQLLLSPTSHYRGWQPLGTNVTRFEGGFTPDLHEALDYFKEEDPAAVQAAGLPASPIHGANPWPSQIPEFTNALKSYISAMQQLGAAVLRGIALGLGLPEHSFGGAFADPAISYYVCRVIYYPPLPSQNPQQAAAAAGEDIGRDVQLSCGEHTDYGLLTLVNQDAHVTALQVKNAQGQWVDAAPLPGTFVCNIGDMFEVLTNGLYKPTLHRVLNASSSSSSSSSPSASADTCSPPVTPPRVSVPFFYEPGYEAVVQPVPQLCSSHQSPPRFGPVRYGSHLESKVLTNFEGLEEVAAAG